MSGPVVRALEDLHLIKARRDAGGRRYELMHPRLARTLHGLGERPVPVRRPGPAARLRAAEVALCEGAADLARHHTEGVIRACGKDDLRVLGRAELLLGNIAHEQGRPAPAVRHYRSAAQIFEVLQDTRAVGLLLAAVGRLVMDVNAAEAVSELRTAANRLPNDLTVHIALGQALWQAGQIRAALAVLDGVLARDGDASEALRTRGEILADLGQAGPALRDLSRVDRGGRSSTEAAWLLAVTMHARGASTADAETDGPGTADVTGAAGEAGAASPAGGAGGTGGTGRTEQAGAAGRSGATGQAGQTGEAGEARAALDGAGHDAGHDAVDSTGDGTGGGAGDGGPDPGSGARRGRPTPDALPADRRAPELPAVPDAESGPVLLRIARAHRLHGDAEFAAEIAARAVAARHPPLPPQMRDEARGLEHRPFGTDRA
ncbi:tetratricopeptide repeat protein [Actinomadura yumaensis]